MIKAFKKLDYTIYTGLFIDMFIDQLDNKFGSDEIIAASP